MTSPDPAYQETLLRYYEEEIEGAAYFDALCEVFAGEEQKARLRLLAEVERHAARAAAPLLARRGLTVSDARVRDLRTSGEAQARAVPGDWSALVAEMRRTYPGYIAAFEALEDIAPEEDRERLAFFTDHERAALEFLRLEAGGAPGSAAPLERYLAAAPGQQPAGRPG